MDTVRARAVAVTVAIIIDLLVWGGAVATTSGGAVPWWLPVAVTVVGHQSLWFVGQK